MEGELVEFAIQLQPNGIVERYLIARIAPHVEGEALTDKGGVCILCREGGLADFFQLRALLTFKHILTGERLTLAKTQTM